MPRVCHGVGASWPDSKSWAPGASGEYLPSSEGKLNGEDTVIEGPSLKSLERQCRDHQKTSPCKVVRVYNFHAKGSNHQGRGALYGGASQNQGTVPMLLACVWSSTNLVLEEETSYPVWQKRVL